MISKRSNTRWFSLTLALVICLTIPSAALAQNSPPEGVDCGALRGIESVLCRLDEIEEKIDQLPEPLTQVISRGYENRDDADNDHEIVSTGPMIVHVCGELKFAEIGSRVRFKITKGDVTIRKQIGSCISFSDCDERIEETGCLTVGAEANETLVVFLGVGGNTELNTIITVQSTPSATITITD